MKITRLKLKKAIGIQHAMGRDEIEIKFGNNKITMLSGGNASGKTTILSQLHPFKSSFDDRRTAIEDGGLKEIDIIHNGKKYEIIHHFGPKARSFIKEDGVELNENGGVRTFEQIVETKLGVNSDYFKIGKIGSNTENFIGFTTAERKSYISKFLPDIDEYLKLSEIVRKKFNEIEGNMKRISDDLSKYSDPDTIKLELEQNSKLIEGLETSISSLNSRVGSTQTIIDGLKEDVSKINRVDLSSRVSEIEKTIESMNTSSVEFVEEFGDLTVEELEKFVEVNVPIFNNLNTEFKIVQADLNRIRTSLQNELSEISNLKLRIEGTETVENVELLKKEIKFKSEKLDELKIKTSSYLPEFKLREGLVEDLSKFNTFKNFIITYHSQMNRIYPTIDTSGILIEHMLNDGMEMKIKSRLTELGKLLEVKNNLIASRGTLIEVKEEKLVESSYYNEETKKEYAERFTGLDKTKLYHDAFKHVDTLNEIKELQEEIKKLESDKREISIKIEEVQEIQTINQEFRYYLKELKDNTGLSLLRENHGDLLSVIKNPTSLTDSILSALSEKLDSIVFNIDSEKTLESELEKLKRRVQIAEGSSKLSDELKRQVKDKEKFIEENNKIVEEKSEIYNHHFSKLTILQKSLAKHREYLKYKNEYNSLIKESADKSEELSRLDKLNRTIAENSSNLNELKSQLISQETRRRETNDKILSNKVALSEIQNMKNRLDELDKTFKDTKLVRAALDPNKGIPLIFIQAYLDKTKSIANKLLAEAFKDSKFEIDFVTSEKDFFIRVRSGDNVKADISEGSQGELALTTLSISLALIEQAIGEYNILTLDEVDGPLDRDNRSNFLNIINKQIQVLDIEQVFVISHNDAFDSEPLDLILLDRNNSAQKGLSYFENKEVIFDSTKN